MHIVARAAAGAVAGAAGTLAMDLLWYRRYRRGGGDDPFPAWEFATGVPSFEEASAPAQVGRRIAGALGVELPDTAASATTNVMHWITGAGYGKLHGLVNAERGVVVGGLLTGGGAWLASYAVLGAMGVYRPLWEYDGDVLAEDLTAHLLFGLVTSATYRLLTDRAAGHT